jgi:hypothetical protein
LSSGGVIHQEHRLFVNSAPLGGLGRLFQPLSGRNKHCHEDCIEALLDTAGSVINGGDKMTFWLSMSICRKQDMGTFINLGTMGWKKAKKKFKKKRRRQSKSAKWLTRGSGRGYRQLKSEEIRV